MTARSVPGMQQTPSISVMTNRLYTCNMFTMAVESRLKVRTLRLFSERDTGQSHLFSYAVLASRNPQIKKS